MRLFLIIWMNCAVVLATAQSIPIRGIVVDNNNLPISDVTVQILNSEKATTTQANGTFVLTSTVAFPSLVFSHMNYASVVLKIEEKSASDLQIVLTQRARQLSEVVVEANHKQEQLLAVPAAVTVLTSEKINQMQIWNVNDLSGIVPNFQYADLGVGYQQQVAIRGISIFSETPATATYVDGVAALDVSATGLQLMDVERIEVLRGPQGTLYGRNAMGGVISIKTAKSNSNTHRGFAEVSLGNQGLQRYGFGLKHPLIQNKLSLSMAGQYQKWHGFYTNDLSEATVFDRDTKERISLKGTLEDGIRMGDNESYYGNLSLRYSYSPKLSFNWNNVFQYEHSIGASSYYTAAATNEIAIQKPRKFMVNDLGSHHRKFFGSSLNSTYYNPRYTLTSTTAFQRILQAYHHIDQDLLPDNAVFGSSYRNQLGDPFPQTVFSQEIRVQSEGNNRWNWTCGLYLFSQHFDKQYAAVYKDLALMFGMQPGTQISKTDFLNRGAAFYAQADYSITSKLKAVAGLRIDYENRVADVGRYYLNDDRSRTYDVNDTTMRSNFGAISPKAVLQYELGTYQQAYASYTRGFRAGGNNLFSGGKYLSYEPEFSNNIELGYKSAFLENRVRFSAALFYIHWVNMQLDMNPEPGYWIIDNVGYVNSRGAEAEISALPWNGAQLDASFGWNNARYGDFYYLGKNIKGNRAILAPETTTMIGLQQSFYLKKNLHVIARGDWRRMGDHYFDLVNSIKQDAYNLFNLRFSVNYRKTQLSIWSQNVGNITYLTFAMPGYFKHSIVNRPRTVGLTLRNTF
ncbi:TonB-dependent receptor [Sphingobacterium spiritivorum]|uniref:TonB-dependent receptor n=1 Tax=Sphingobacterium spiritivorum TaxID=258 RepID=UPI003DA3BEAA